MDNTSKLKPVTFNTKDEYRQLLLSLKPKIKYVKLFHSFDDNDKVILIAKEKMKLIDQSMNNKFFGSKHHNKMPVYTFEFNLEFYNYIKSFGYIFINTDENNVKFNDEFTQVDMAFLDTDMKVIFLIITHEGLAYIEKRE